MEYTYDTIYESDSQQVKDLKRRINNLQAQLETQKSRNRSLRGGNLLTSAPIDLYPGEQLDFVLSILRQVRERCAQDSRPRDIIDSLLELNQPVGRGEEILDKLNRIFSKGMPSSDADIADLRAMGFTYTPSRKHPKLRFHQKYMFVLSNTPSDVRTAKNTLSEINKCIAVGQKV